MSKSPHINNKEKEILVLGEIPSKRLEDTLTAKKLCPINFTKENTKFCLNFYYNWESGYLIPNSLELMLIIMLLRLLIYKILTSIWWKIMKQYKDVRICKANICFNNDVFWLQFIECKSITICFILVLKQVNPVLVVTTAMISMQNYVFQMLLKT